MKSTTVTILAIIGLTLGIVGLVGRIVLSNQVDQQQQSKDGLQSLQVEFADPFTKNTDSTWACSWDAKTRRLGCIDLREFLTKISQEAESDPHQESL